MLNKVLNKVLKNQRWNVCLGGWRGAWSCRTSFVLVVLAVGMGLWMAGCRAIDNASSLQDAVAVGDDLGRQLADSSTPEQISQAIREGNYPHIRFDFDKSDIRPDAVEVLSLTTEHLLDNESVQLLVVGHADERGTNAYNLALGSRRASAVVRVLLERGISRSRIRTVSFGEERPLVRASNEEAWSQNRRVEIKEE